MKLSDIEFKDYPRDDLLKLTMQQAKAPRQAARQAVDLACHAASAARKITLETVERADDRKVMLLAMGLAASLVQSDTENMVEALKEFAAAAGIKFQTSKLSEVVR